MKFQHGVLARFIQRFDEISSGLSSKFAVMPSSPDATSIARSDGARRGNPPHLGGPAPVDTGDVGHEINTVPPRTARS